MSDEATLILAYAGLSQRFQAYVAITLFKRLGVYSDDMTARRPTREELGKLTKADFRLVRWALDKNWKPK